MFQMPDWAGVLVPDLSLVESFARASVVYLSLIVLFRVVMNRQTGSIGLPDVMLVVLVSECVSQSLNADSKSVPNGLAAVAALLFWSYTLDRLSCRWPWLHRRLEPRPVEIVKDGKPIRKNMDSEGLSDEELEVQLRLNGIDDVSKVKSAHIEPEGTVSVVPKEKGDEPPAPRPAETAPDFEAAVRAFAEAADRLKEAIAWHDVQAADHASAAKAARAELARHGIRVPRAGKAATSD
jgi:uncharacterized membrane protein YcaP (DUF421 family)